MAAKCNSDIINLEIKQGFEGKYAIVKIRVNPFKGHKLDVRIIVLGNSKAGKSTLIQVL